MKVLSHAGLHGRDFGSSLLAVDDLKGWLSANRLRMFTAPPIDDYDFVQVECLLVAVEHAAGNITDEEAQQIVDADPFLAQDQMAKIAPRWLVSAEAHRKWRIKLTHAMIRGELSALDFGSKLPVPIPQAAVEAAAQFGPTPEKLAKGIYARSQDEDGKSVTALDLGAEDARGGEGGLTKRERQIAAILDAAATAGYDFMNIPVGGKATLKKECKAARPDLFGAGDDPFKEAWQIALNQNRLRTANHDSYRGK
jgi:hypothetical protein